MMLQKLLLEVRSFQTAIDKLQTQKLQMSGDANVQSDDDINSELCYYWY